MTVRTNVAGADNYVLQEAISAYADEAYTTAKKLSGTGIVGENPNIDTSTETYMGQVKWWKPLTPVINIASLTVADDGIPTTSAQDFLMYVKTVRTAGATKVNLSHVVTQDDGLAKFGRDFAETRAQDEHNAILAVLRGVAISEAINGAAVGSGGTGLGGQTFENDPTDMKYGFYVDLGANNKTVIAASSTVQGAARAEGFLQAFGKAFKDHEPEWAYLVASPETIASLRSANLVDQDRVQDGNIMFNTIFNGKFRLIQTRASQGLSTAELTKINSGAGVDITGTKTTFIVLPGSIAMKALAIDEPTEIEKKAAAYKGGGTTSIWHRWGYVLAPSGYDWAGSQQAFPSDAEYSYVVTAGTPGALTAATNVLTGVTGTFKRKSTSALSLGILPIFHG